MYIGVPDQIQKDCDMYKSFIDYNEVSNFGWG